MTAPPVIEGSGLRVTFPPVAGGATIRVLEVRSFVLRAGEQLAIHGPSGTGKTTLLQVLSGMRTPDAGVVRVGGEVLSGRSEGARDRIRGAKIGNVFQSFHLLPACSALENVLLAMAFAGTVDVVRARRLLERVGLADREGHSPAALSTGQRQRVAVARALANRPAVVLADEPTGNLDGETADDVIDLLRESCRDEGAALLVASHDRTVLAGFERAEPLSRWNAPA